MSRIVETDVVRSGKVVAPPEKVLEQQRRLVEAKLAEPAHADVTEDPEHTPTPEAEEEELILTRQFSRGSRPALLLAGVMLVITMTILGVFLLMPADEVPPETGTMPGPWRDSNVSLQGMIGDTRSNGVDANRLLRFEWPAHPEAESYELRVWPKRKEAQPIVVPVQRTIFMYDLSDPTIKFPSPFTWEVAAILPGGGRVMSPRSDFPTKR